MLLEHFLLPGIGISVAVTVAGFIVPFTQYQLPLKTIGFLMIAASLFATGIVFNDRSWQQKMEKANDRIQELEIQSAKVNEKIVVEYRDKIQYVDRIKVQTVKEFVTSVDDSKCSVNQGFVELYNSSALGTTTIASPSVEAPSEVKLSDIAEVTKQNNAQYLLIKSRLESLQDWVTQQINIWNAR